MDLAPHGFWADTHGTSVLTTVERPWLSHSQDTCELTQNHCALQHETQICTEQWITVAITTDAKLLDHKPQQDRVKRNCAAWFVFPVWVAHSVCDCAEIVLLRLVFRGVCEYLGFDPMHSWHACQAD